MSLLTDERLILAETLGGSPGILVESSVPLPFEEFHDEVSAYPGYVFAWQESKISLQSMKGSSSVLLVNDDFIPQHALSRFHVAFEVAADISYELSGYLDGFGWAEASVELRGTQQGVVFSDSEDWYIGPFLTNGVLAPGSYELELIAEGWGDAVGGLDYSAEWGFLFTVPEPGSLVLLGLSVVGLAVLQRQRTRGQSGSANATRRPYSVYNPRSMSRIASLLSVLVAFLASVEAPSTAWSAPINVSWRGTIHSVLEPDKLPAEFRVGAAFTVSYTIDEIAWW